MLFLLYLLPASKPHPPTPHETYRQAEWGQWYDRKALSRNSEELSSSDGDGSDFHVILVDPVCRASLLDAVWNQYMKKWKMKKARTRK
jgi:hypothetical protein